MYIGRHSAERKEKGDRLRRSPPLQKL